MFNLRNYFASVLCVVLYHGTKGAYWSFSGILHSTFSLSLYDVSMTITQHSLITCLFQCTYDRHCLIASYDTSTQTCLGYNRTDMIGPFKPEDQDVEAPSDHISLYFNYDYAISVGFTSNLQSGVSYRISDFPATQSEAETECQKWNAHLIAFRYVSQLDELVQVLSRDPALASQFFYVSGTGNGIDVVYRNGESVPFAFWMSGQPQSFFDPYCVALTPQGLAAVSCTEQRHFICSLL